MWANNETGVVHDVASVGAVCRERGVPFHVDAVQAAGKLALELGRTPIDLCTLSAHKLHGPKGVGALYVRRGSAFEAWQRGGGQENERRAGTENVPGIVGFGRAAELARSSFSAGGSAELARLRDRLEAGLLERVPDCHVNGGTQERTPNTTNLRFAGVSGEALVMLLSEEGICASTGSACSSARHAPSHVLAAMGLAPEQVSESLRLSLSRETTDEQVDLCLEVVPRVVGQLRSLAGHDR
jgi:cysteine desulfurase